MGRTMKIFLSWSGNTSKQVAETLRDWLPEVIQAARPWISARDIDKGARWNEQIGSQLEQGQFGIICLTRDNLRSAWIHFEAGALAKTTKDSHVCTYLFDVDHSDVDYPLAQFQHTKASKDDTFKLI